MEQVGHVKHSIQGPGPPASAHWYVALGTLTNTHSLSWGTRYIFKQHFFQTLAFVFLEGMGWGRGRQEEEYAFKNSIKPNLKVKELQELRCRAVGNFQKPHTFITERVCTKHSQRTRVPWMFVVLSVAVDKSLSGWLPSCLQSVSSTFAERAQKATHGTVTLGRDFWEGFYLMMTIATQLHEATEKMRSV